MKQQARCKTKALEILKDYGVHGSEKSHQFSFTLVFDGLLQTCVDYMHREMLGMMKLHFKCLWESMPYAKRKILSERVKQHPKVLHYATFSNGLLDVDEKCFIKGLYSREWVALSKFGFVCLEGLVQPRQLACWVEHCTYATLLRREILTDSEYKKLMLCMTHVHKNMYELYKNHVFGKEKANLDDKPNFHQGERLLQNVNCHL